MEARTAEQARIAMRNTHRHVVVVRRGAAVVPAPPSLHRPRPISRFDCLSNSKHISARETCRSPAAEISAAQPAAAPGFKAIPRVNQVHGLGVGPSPGRARRPRSPPVRRAWSGPSARWQSRRAAVGGFAAARLPTGDPGVRRDAVLQEVNRHRAQDPTKLGEGGGDIGDDAEGERGERAVAARVRKDEVLRVGADEVDLDRRTLPDAARRRATPPRPARPPGRSPLRRSSGRG